MVRLYHFDNSPNIISFSKNQLESLILSQAFGRIFIFRQFYDFENSSNNKPIQIHLKHKGEKR